MIFVCISLLIYGYFLLLASVLVKSVSRCTMVTLVDPVFSDQSKILVICRLARLTKYTRVNQAFLHRLLT